MSAVLRPRPVCRPMLADDLDAVIAVEVRAYSHPWSRGNFADSLRAGYLATVWFDEDGVLLGYCVAMSGVEELHLLNITVAPEFQGQGHGQRMIAALCDEGRRQRAATLWLEVRESNQRARALYRRLGFTEVGLRRAYYPAAVRREDAVVMSLPLGSAAPAGAPHGLD